MSARATVAQRAARGCLTACAFLAAASQALGTPPERRFQFDVFLDDRPLGTHEFFVRGDPDSVAEVQSDARFEFRLLGINIYRYRHHASERWVSGCLQSVQAKTDDNGRERQVVGALHGGSFEMTQPPGLAPLAGCIATYAYWDRDRLLRQNRLLNPQTGKADAVSVELMGRTTLVTTGGLLTADRYRIQSTGNFIDLWYTPEGDWLQLESTLESGRRRIVYRRHFESG